MNGINHDSATGFLWHQPEKVFGRGYSILPIWKDRLNAKTLIPIPNSDVIYAMDISI